VAPKLLRVGVLRQAGTPVRGDIRLSDLRAAATVLKVKLEEIETEADAKGLESAFRTAKQKQVNAIMIGGGRLFFAQRKRIVELAVQHRLPAIYPQEEFVDDGGLMSYGADVADLYRPRPTTWTRSSRERNLPIYLCNRQRSSNSLLTSRQQNRLV